MAHADLQPINYEIHPQALRTWRVVTTAAKTTYNDLTNALEVGGVGPLGGEIIGFTAIPQGSVTATQLQIYTRAGSDWIQLLTTELMSPHTMSPTTKCAPTSIRNPDTGELITPNAPYPLGPYVSLYVAQSVALAPGIAWTVQVRAY